MVVRIKVYGVCIHDSLSINSDNTIAQGYDRSGSWSQKQGNLIRSVAYTTKCVKHSSHKQPQLQLNYNIPVLPTSNEMPSLQLQI